MQTEITAQAVKTGSYVGAGTSILSAITLTEWGIIVGIATAVLTFLLNWWYQHKKNKREQTEHEYRMGMMGVDNE